MAQLRNLRHHDHYENMALSHVLMRKNPSSSHVRDSDGLVDLLKVALSPTRSAFISNIHVVAAAIISAV